METKKVYEGMEDGSHIFTGSSETIDEFVMPISVAASWNWRFAKRFHLGVGIAPTLYVQPQAVFDLSVMAKVGYRLSKCCEFGLSYQYGCLNTLKHFAIMMRVLTSRLVIVSEAGVRSRNLSFGYGDAG